MDLAQEFERHAADCELMAKLTRDGESKAQWRDLAARFRQCANKAVQPPGKALSHQHRSKAPHARDVALMN